MEQGSDSLIQYRDGSWIRLNTGDKEPDAPSSGKPSGYRSQSQYNTTIALGADAYVGSHRTLYDASQTSFGERRRGSEFGRRLSLPHVITPDARGKSQGKAYDNLGFYEEGGLLYELPIAQILHARPHMVETALSTADKDVQVSLPVTTASDASIPKRPPRNASKQSANNKQPSRTEGLESGSTELISGSKERSVDGDGILPSPESDRSGSLEAASLEGTLREQTDDAALKIEDVSLNHVPVSKDDPESPSSSSRKGCCRGGAKVWCLKYFWEGQSLTDAGVSGGPWWRRPVALLLPAAVFQVCWWGMAVRYSLWHLFPDKYFMTLTMVVGSIIAGMTSEGGGAIAFPVMTLAFNISPSVARDFSIMIQSCGMTAAAVSIFMMRIQLEHHSLALCTIGGAIGIIFGFNLVDPHLTPAQKKMGFVSIWFSFAFALFLLNRIHKRKTFQQVVDFSLWKGVLLLCTGFVGGIFTSFSGSGLDICSFSILTLLFRVSEKVATPTSVVLMAGNSVTGFFWRGLLASEPISQEAWEFLAVCVPVVVLGAPLGSVLGSHFHRQVLAGFVYVVDIAALVGAFALVPLSPALLGASVAIVVGGFAFFMMLTYAGHRLMLRTTANAKKQLAEKETKTESEVQ